MADGELFAAMHDVGLAEFVAKGLDKKHRKALPALDISAMTTAKAKVRDDFGGKKIFELWCASALRRFVLARWIFDDSGADYHDLKALARFLLRVANLSAGASSDGGEGAVVCKGFADDMQTEEAKESALLNSKGQLAELRAAMGAGATGAFDAAAFGAVPGFDPVAPFPGPESSYATPRRATWLGIYGNLRTTSTTFSSCAGRLASLGESRHTAFFLACERGITNID